MELKLLKVESNINWILRVNLNVVQQIKKITILKINRSIPSIVVIELKRTRIM